MSRPEKTRSPPPLRREDTSASAQERQGWTIIGASTKDGEAAVLEVDVDMDSTPISKRVRDGKEAIKYDVDELVNGTRRSSDRS